MTKTDAALPPQCIMTLPDKLADGMQQEFTWEEEIESDYSSPSTSPHRAEKKICVDFVQGTTIVFDSFSDEQDVQRRNLAAINISKISDAARRFETDFTVNASGKVTAVLGANTVAKYRVVDIKGGARIPTPAPMPSFSSVISMAASDRELVSSLAACANADPTTDNLRKRCRSMLKQRYVNRPETTPNDMVNQKNNYALNMTTPMNDTTGMTTPFYPATATMPTRAFFAPVIRPIAVQQALSQIKLERGGMDHDGQLVDGGSGAAEAKYIPVASTSARPRRLTFESNGMGDDSNLTFTAPSSATAPGASAQMSSMPLSNLRPAPGVDVTLQSAFSIFTAMDGVQKPSIILPPLTIPPDGHRVSSSDLILAAMTCPLPVGELTNMSDIFLRRSSDELIVLAGTWHT
jgi:hypothetical protein